MAVNRKGGGSCMLVGMTFWIYLVFFAGMTQGDGLSGRRRAKRDEGPLYSSVCENQTMNLRCQPGQQILIESANFGRTDSETCVRGSVEKTNCKEPKSFEIVSASCNYENYCGIEASSKNFRSKVCLGTYKYLEVQFHCIEPLRGTRITYFHVTLAEQPTIATTAVPQTTVEAVPKTTAATLPKTTERVLPQTTVMTTLRQTTDSQTTPKPSAVAPKPVTTAQVARETTAVLDEGHFCPATYQRKINWPQTESGSLSTQPCPVGTNDAKWKCEGRPARWFPESGPDLSLCTSKWAEDLEEQPSSSATEISEVIADSVENNNEIFGGDLLVVTTLMKDSLDSLKKELVGLNETQKFEMAKTVTKNYVKIGSTVLGGPKLESWQDLPGSEKTKTATELLASIEQSGFVLAENLGSQDIVTSEEVNVVLEVVVQDASKGDLQDVVFPRLSQLTTSEWQDITDSISIPKASLEDRSKDGQSKVVFIAYNNLGDLLESSNFEQENSEANYIVNSRIISASIGNPLETASLSEPAVIVFEHSQENLTSPMCSFWKFMNTTPGEWSDTGCSLVDTNKTHTVCSCSHLTNFAILMNTKGVAIARGHEFVLSVITYFGFIISSICLLMAFLTFAYFKNLQNDRNTIHKNLCLCLLLAEIIFMAGIDQSSRGAMCTVVALFLHYFFLAAFAWMCLEGIQLYVMLVEVFEAESSRRKYYYPFGYGLPLFVVGISAAVDIGSYGTPKYCWLAVENNFIWAFVAPVIIVIVVNTMFLSMAIFIMCRHSTMQTNQREKTNKEKITLGSNKVEVAASWVRGALVLLCLLGITWCFGLLYIAENLLIFAYIFTIANVFQGTFIFVFHCFMNEKVIKEYQRYIRNSTWMPNYIRDRYGGTFFTGSNQHRSSSSSGKKRIWSQEEKRLSNTTGSCSMDHRKMSTSSNGRNSGEYIPVRFTATAPEKKDTNQRLSDEGIGLEMEDGHMEVGQVANSSPVAPPRRNRNLSGNSTEVRPLLNSPTEKEPPRHPPPSYRHLPPPTSQRKSSNFTSLPDLANPPNVTVPSDRDSSKKGSLPELPRSPIFLRNKIARLNSDSQRAGHWSPLDEQRPEEVDIADDNSGKVEFLGMTPRRETLI